MKEISRNRLMPYVLLVIQGQEKCQNKKQQAESTRPYRWKSEIRKFSNTKHLNNKTYRPLRYLSPGGDTPVLAGRGIPQSWPGDILVLVEREIQVLSEGGALYLTVLPKSCPRSCQGEG